MLYKVYLIKQLVSVYVLMGKCILIKIKNKTHPAALSGKFVLCADSLIGVLKC